MPRFEIGTEIWVSADARNGAGMYDGPAEISDDLDSCYEVTQDGRVDVLRDEQVTALAP